MHFTKMQGIGNDYVYIDCFKETVAHPDKLAVEISNRHFGVGSDGLILIAPSNVADCKMIMYNKDGTQGEMCGNGIRCVGKYVYDNNIAKKESVTVETSAGIKCLNLHTEGGKVSKVTVNMGKPILNPKLIPVDVEQNPAVNCLIKVLGRYFYITCVSMGNPHAVLFMNSIDDFDIETVGPAFEKHKIFPKRTNTEFVEILDESHIRMRVWERGSGETLACGTGACAAVVASVLHGLTNREVEVALKGGQLNINWSGLDECIYMTGPAVTVFEGDWPEHMLL
ncbi:MAG: diaminopimelate epimerase [Lachnospiraceae bacterium]